MSVNPASFNLKTEMLEEDIFLGFWFLLIETIIGAIIQDGFCRGAAGAFPS